MRVLCLSHLNYSVDVLCRSPTYYTPTIPAAVDEGSHEAANVI